MFYIKTGALYRRTKNGNGVSSFGALLRNIACKVEPVQDLTGTGLEGIPAYNIRKVFTPDLDIRIGDKLIIDTVSYQVEGQEVWNGLMSHYSRLYCKISEGT